VHICVFLDGQSAEYESVALEYSDSSRLLTAGGNARGDHGRLVKQRNRLLLKKFKNFHAI
jgi:hypothetical protein